MSHRSSSLSTAESHLRVDGLSVSFAGHRVLTDVSFVVPAGSRVGVIGENGAGKSTLLAAIAGVIEPTAGSVRLIGAGDAPVIGLLHQVPPFAPDDSLTQALERAVKPIRLAAIAVGRLGEHLSRNADDPAVADAYSQALQTADRLGAWEVDSRIGSTISGVGLDGIDLRRSTGSLSGGQRSRLALACVLLGTPDALLLDEPTNHLDDAATEYLVSRVTAWRGPVLTASHDRAFLDEAVTSLLDLDPSPLPHRETRSLLQDGTGTGIGVSRFGGTYSAYLLERADARRMWERTFRDEQAELARLRASMKDQQSVGHTDARPRTEVRAAQKFYADRNARVVSRRVNDSRDRWERLSADQVRRPPADLAFGGLTAAGTPRIQGAAGPVLSLAQAAVDGRLMPVSIAVGAGEKWLVTGPNGPGKSTLLSLLAGTRSPDAGTVTRASWARVSLLAQEVKLPDPRDRGPKRTVGETYSDLAGDARADEIPLTTYGLIALRDIDRPIDELSVGQRRRVALAVLLADPPEVLLLDEPTNHFSLALVTALEEALVTYPGTVVVASHDRWLRSRWSGRKMRLGLP